MTARSIRRAAERKALKQARKAANQLTNHAEISPAQLDANRANAQLSTGPTTPAGKAVSRLNAVTTGLTGRTVVLSTDDAAAYRAHVTAYQNEFQPVGQRESDLVQSIADCVWRLQRIPGLEMAIFAQGTLEFAACYDEHDPSLRPGMIELQTFLTYEKQLRNLHLQESRLARRREKEIAELQTLQKERKAKESEALEAAAKHTPSPQPPVNGFDFSTAEIALPYRAPGVSPDDPAVTNTPASA